MRNIIKKILIEGDFDWVDDEPINPWYDYDGVIFDIPISYNVVNDYIDMAFKARPDISNKAVWQRERTRHDISTIIGYANNGKAYLAVDKETSNLSHANAKRFWGKGEKWVKYSDLVNESLTESSDFDWASGFEWSKEMLDSMLTDCKTLRVANFNVSQKQPYQSAGGPSVMYLTRCKDWWDYLSQLPLDDSGRGPAEWFTPEYYENGNYGVVWNYHWRTNKETPTLEMLDDDYTSAITISWVHGIERQLNGTSSSEAWFAVDGNNKPIYDLIPPNVQKYAKIYEEYFFGDKINESEDGDWDWAKEIKTVPYDITNIKSYPFGNYKIWLGDTSIESQLMVLDYLINLINNDDDLETSASLKSIRSGVSTGRLDINSLYFDIRKNRNKKFIILSMMAWYPIKDTTITREQSLENGLRYFNGSNNKDLRKVSVNESNQDANDYFDWAREIPGTKEYGQEYRYFEIIACYGIDYETEECDDEYSHFIRIPKGEVEEIWRWSIGYMGGPGDEGEAVISYAIDNNLIPPRELEEIIMFQGVVEVSELDRY